MKLHYDLHIHSLLSPCGDMDMTPNNIVNMAKVCKLDLIALTDHNTTGNLAAVFAAGQRAGITVVPGLELETAEEIHVVCYFPTVAAAEQFDREVVTPALPPVKNRPEIFGEQLRMDEWDHPKGADPRYLINATGVSVDHLPELARRYGGVAVPAHLDKQTKSLVSVFGMVGDYMEFCSFELSRNAPPDFLASTPGVDRLGYRFLHNSDAHYLQDIGEHSGENLLDLPEKSAAALIRYLLNDELQKKSKKF